MYGVVYLILNKINGRKYVGQTIQPLKVRFNEHASKRNNAPLGKAIKKYGRENFYCGVIKTCASKEELDYWEKYYIAALHCKAPYGYNLTDGGEGATGCSRTPEQRAKLSAIYKGKSRPPEVCAKISAGKKGKSRKPFSTEWRVNISAGLKGHKKTPKHCANISAAQKGKRLSSEHIAKISVARKGKPLSVGHRAKIAATEREYSPFKNLLCEIDKRHLTHTALGKILGYYKATISRKMRGVSKFTESDRVKLEDFFGKPADYLLECNFVNG